jgi:tetratricopeptide (TPR) repeat protein
MSGLNRFQIKLFLFAAFIVAVYLPLSAQYFMLPDDIVQSYFPPSAQYTIPEDKRVSQIVDRAKSLEEAGNYRQASRYYEYAYNRAQDSNAAPYIRFKQCYLLENLQDSIKLLKEIVQRYPDFSYIDAVRWELARRYYLNSNYEECISALKAILDNESGGAEVFTPYVFGFMGIARQAMKKYDEAIEAHLMAIERLAQYEDETKRPFIVRNYLEIARSYLEKNEYDRASDLLRRIIGTGEDPTIKQEAYILLAETYAQKGEAENAHRAYSQLLEHYPASLYSVEAKRSLAGLGVDEKSLGDAPRLDIYDRRILEGSYTYGEETKTDHEAGFFVQVGSFGIESNAENLVAVLKDRGFSAAVEEAVLEQKQTFRVWVGPFATLAEARETLKLLDEQGYEGYVVSEK